MLNRCGLFAER